MKKSGFTIVELLIVIVVIAILAAITIVAYNGIQNRAKSSAVQSTAKQAYTKVATYAVQNADTYPSTLTPLALPSADGITYQYYVNNAALPKRFCVSATNSTASFYLSNNQNSPRSGTCNEQNILSTAIDDWSSGDYSQSNGNQISAPSRLRLNYLVAVEPGASYLMNTGNSSFDFVVRGFGADMSFAGSVGGIVTGSTYTVPANMYYLGVGIYGSSSATYDSYAQGFANGTFLPVVTRV